MRRFEFEEGKSHKFWEVHVEGTAWTVRYGKVGTDGQTQTKTEKTAAKAESEAEKKIAEKTKKGYVEVAVAAGSAAPTAAAKEGTRNAELEQAIFDAPEDPQAWSVYADWLQGQGDPWGERLSLGIAHAGAKGAEKTKIKKAIDKLDEAHGEHFYGKSLQKLMAAKDFDQVAKLDWAYGMIVGIRSAAPEFEWSGTGADSILRAVVKSPAGRFLRSVRLGIVENDGEGNLDGGIDALSKSGTLGAMRDLFVGDFEYPEESEISWVEIGDVDKLLTVMPNLRTLRVRGADIGLGKLLEHEKLESLTIETGGLPAATVKAIGKCKLPNLRRMEVWLGQKNYGGDGNVKMLEPLFTGAGVPKLEHLGLMNAEFEDDIAMQLVKSPLLARLKSLDLSMGTLRDAGGQAILDNADSFAHLESIDLSHNYLSDAVAKALQKKFGKKIDLSNRQKPHVWGDAEHFYTSVGE